MADADAADGGLFGRPVTPQSDDSPLSTVRWALSFPRTMDAETVVKGGVLVIMSAFYLPIPLLFGYTLAAVRAAGAGEPAPAFENWGRLYLRGVGLIALQLAVSVGMLFAVAFVSVLVNPSDSVTALLWLGGWAYLTPWTVAIYGQGSWRAFLDEAAWRWLVSPQYLLTAALTALVAGVGSLLFALSFLTLVGWLFVGFLLLPVVAAVVGQRYHGYLTATDSTGSAGSITARLRDALSTASAETARDGTTGESTQAERTDGEASADAETDYTRFRERARHVESEGGIERLEAGDGGRVQFVSLTVEDEAAVAAFERAADRWEGISGSAAVTTVHDTGDEPTPWVAYDPLEGSLRTMGELPPPAVVAVTGAVADAMTTGRRYNIAHGAVRPACVFVERSDGAGPARDRVNATVGDWELQRDLAAVTDAVTLPTRYCAPEQFGDGPTDDRVDVYQLAATAHYALFGEAPFSDTEPAALERPDRSVAWAAPDGWQLDDETAAVFERALAADPEDRHESPSAFHDALRRALPDEA